MKGSAVPRLNYNDNHVLSMEESYSEQPNAECEDLLSGLGFEEGELEMFFDTYQATEDDLVDRYIDIARESPYNLNWQNSHDACVADYMLGVFKNNGVEYTKHDIVDDVFDSFYNPQQAGKKKKSRRLTKKRLNKKKRNTRRKRRYSRK